MLRKLIGLLGLLLLATMAYVPTAQAQTINNPFIVTLCYRVSGTTCTLIGPSVPMPVTSKPIGPGTPTLTSVAVTASTSTQVIAANAARRGLIIVPNSTNTTCLINPAGGTASATSLPIPGGYAWGEFDPPPATAVTIFCTTAGNVAVVEIN